MKRFDVIVIGAGHAGCEAALAAARMHSTVLLLTISRDRIAMMPCNPSIGGIGKGHLVSEIDSLGGEIGFNSDKSMIQIKTLNTKKGPAVRALRAQSDRLLYSWHMKKTLLEQKGLLLTEDQAEEIQISKGRAVGVKGVSGTVYRGNAVIVAAGTFLNGKVIIGHLSTEAGRMGEKSAKKLSSSLRKAGIAIDRFQSATPPRIDGRTIDFRGLTEQPGDESVRPFSYKTVDPLRHQRSCYLTYTSEVTHQIVRDNLHVSPIRTGMIDTHGPRFCPSIDRKVVNFPEKKRHPVFVEPEGWKTQEYYLQGLTTSLPVDVQVKILEATPGLSGAKLTRPGYAIEYDYFPPHQLWPTLESKVVDSLFLAGQVNGTSGYEEAAAQGFIAGVNAVRKIRGEEEFILKRSEAYIGVMIDDLVTKGVDEPYRVFTSRAEFRLTLRSDNADVRLTQKGFELGLISPERMLQVKKKKALIDTEMKRFQNKRVHLFQSETLTVNGGMTKEKKSLKSIAAMPESDIKTLELLDESFEKLPAEIKAAILAEIKYSGYIKRQNVLIERQNRLEKIRIPEELDYCILKGLRFESKEKLKKARPLTLGQAGRIPGITPADVSVLNIYIHKEQYYKPATDS